MANAAQQISQHLGVDDALFRKQVKGGASWSELENVIEPSIRNQIANSSKLCLEVSSLVIAEGLNTPEFTISSQGVMRDLQYFADNLNALIARRADRTGPTNNPSEYTEYIALGMEMTDLSNQLSTLVGHGLIGLTDYHHNAIEKRQARLQAELDATDASKQLLIEQEQTLNTQA